MRNRDNLFPKNGMSDICSSDLSLFKNETQFKSVNLNREKFDKRLRQKEHINYF